MIAAPFAVSPLIQAVFDALKAVLDSDATFSNANAYASRDATGGQNVGITITDQYASSATYSLHIVTGKVVVDPMTASLGPGDTQQFAATTTDGSGNPVAATVTWSVPVGSQGTIDAAGLYTAPASIPSALNSYVTATSPTGSSATATVMLHP